MEPLEAPDPAAIGPYLLRARLGAGRLGPLYLGADAAGDLAAVRIVHPVLARDDGFRSRFRRRVEAGRRATGPWVAPVVDADVDADPPWLATRYVPGVSLGAVVAAAGPLPAETVHVLGHALAVALAAVHEAGLVHGDLRPTDVLLDDDHPRLLDVGVAGALDGTTELDTSAFHSPELIAGADPSPASDVFALGAVLVHAVTGGGPPGDLAAVPDRLRGAISACLAERPADRPSAAQFGRLLGPVAPGGPGWPPTALAALTTAATVPASVAASVPAPVTVPPPATAPVVPTPRTRRAHGGPSRRVVLAGTIGLAVAAGLGAGTRPGTTRSAPPAPPLGPPEPELRWTVPFPGRFHAWAADDTTVYAYSDKGVVRAVDGETGEDRWIVHGWAREPGSDWRVSLAPVGGALVIGTAAAVAALDPGTGRRRWVLPRSVPSAPVATAAGVVLAATADRVVALDLATGAQRWSTAAHGASGSAPVAAHGDRGFVVVPGDHHRLEAVDLRRGELLWQHDTGVGEEPPQLVGAGGAVYLASGDALLALDAATGERRWRVRLAPGNRVHQKLVDVVGDVLVAHVGDGTEYGLVVRGFDTATGAQRWSAPVAGGASAADPVTADGIVYLATRNGPTFACDVSTSEQRWALGGHPDHYTPVAARGSDAYLFEAVPGLLHAVADP